MPRTNEGYKHAYVYVGIDMQKNRALKNKNTLHNVVITEKSFRMNVQERNVIICGFFLFRTNQLLNKKTLALIVHSLLVPSRVQVCFTINQNPSAPINHFI